MKAAYGCKLFGAQQALTGIQDGVVLLHSVVGCNFGSMAFHAPCDMTDVRQVSTVISDSDVVFGGEASLSRALAHVEELYQPPVIFVVTGCVSDIIQDDVGAVADGFSDRAKVIPVEAAGFRGSFRDGYEAGLSALLALMEPCPRAERPTVNLLGVGLDEPRLGPDLEAVRALLGEQVQLGAVLSRCTTEELRRAPAAHLNLVLGRGEKLAQEMERKFGIPYELLDYPYGLTGAEALWSALEARFAVHYQSERDAFSRRTAQGLAPIYSYLHALYGMPAAVLASGPRCRGLVRFLTRELGLEAIAWAERETVSDLEDFYDRVRGSEAALLFGSSFEGELAEGMGIPLLRMDYPVFDRVCVTNRPYVGAEGTLCFVEDLLNEIMAGRTLKGALYQ